jgi:predicted TIM-barrel fold metal-dependent hydrolase
VIIDAHAHVWPDHIARRVLAARPVGLTPMGDGTLDGLRATMDSAGIDLACCLAIANVAAHVMGTNRFIGAIDRSRFVPFGTVHPDLPIEQNLASLRDNGIRGVKLHPLFQQLSLADTRVIELLGALAEDGIVVITHAGAGGDDAANERGNPRYIRALTEKLPDLVLIACHYGGYHRLDEAAQTVVGSGAILETSWPPTVAALDRERVRGLIDAHGGRRVVFGSDWPMADPGAEIAALRELGLPPDDEAALLGGTLAGLLGIGS